MSDHKRAQTTAESWHRGVVTHPLSADEANLSRCYLALLARVAELEAALHEVVRLCICEGKLETMRLIGNWGDPQPIDPCNRPQCLAARAALRPTENDP